MRLALFIILLGSYSAFCQKPDFYVLSGKFVSTTFYQGGVESAEPPPESPLVNKKLWLVRLNPSDSIPEKVMKVISDDKGNFSISVPRGKYGFVLPEDLKIMRKYQYTPTNYGENHSYGTRYDSTWEINTYGPIVIDDQDVSDIILYNHHRTICYLCP